LCSFRLGGSAAGGNFTVLAFKLCRKEFNAKAAKGEKKERKRVFDRINRIQGNGADVGWFILSKS